MSGVIRWPRGTPGDDSWKSRGACFDNVALQAILFVESGTPVRSPQWTEADRRVARGICGECDVQAECLDYAMSTNQQFGIWGGLTPSERTRRRRERVRA